MIRMKKLVSSGVPGANEGYVARGREFTVPNEQRAKDLEANGLAYRLADALQPEPVNQMVPGAVINEAAVAGPLSSPGGMIGEGEPVPSSRRVRQQQRRRSQLSKGET